MGIIEATSPQRVRSTARVSNLARMALLSGAVFVAVPRAAKGSNFNWIGQNNDSWFNTANWTDGTTTGMLPESGGVNSTFFSINITANNTTMPATGVLFDPANQIGNANYVAKVEVGLGNTLSFYIASANNSGSFSAAPNKLTIDSGTLETFAITVGRDDSGVLVLNGGLLIADSSLKVGGANALGDGVTTKDGSGTFEYHGGSLIVGNSLVVGSGNNNEAGPNSLTTPATGKFVVYNDGVNGAITASNGFIVAFNTQNAGTIGIVEFHYDLNQTGVGNTRPIQMDVNSTNAVLKLNNSTNQLSELSLVLDSAPQSLSQNLGLFKENTITGAGTFPKIFYATDGTTGYTQGATISSTFGGITYSWTISYSGLITFSNTATSAYDGALVIATGGNDVVLVGLPEPSSMALVGGVGSMILTRRRRKIASDSAS